MKRFAGSTPREDDLLLVNAYLDGELDAAAALAIEQRMADEPALKNECDRLLTLRRLFNEKLSKDTASEALRDRIVGLTGSGEKDGHLTIRRSTSWRQMAAAALVGACLASGTTFLITRFAAPNNTLTAIVAGHQRALLAATPFDVASSDRHTVKPWFDAKLAISPQIPDLAAAGFPLAGGRVDIVGAQAVPTLVYRHGPHLISLVAMPTSGSHDEDASPQRQTGNGYTVLTWRGQDFTYAAVSDVAEETLAEFVARWRAEVQAK